MRRDREVCRLGAGAVAVWVALAGIGCNRSTERANPQAAAQAEAIVERWERRWDELPTVKLVAISPHNTNIQNEYEWAFSVHHALKYGQAVDIEWRDVGGGGSAIMTYLRNVYAGADSSDIDVLWGGGEYMFARMAKEGVLQPMVISEDVERNIPAVFGGVQMRDPDGLWCGSAVSGFGFLCNRPVLGQLGIDTPELWDDLADPRMFGQVCLADPTQSGSAAAAYEMIVQSAPDWPSGWAKLLAVLSNAWRFEGSAGAAAKTPAWGAAAVATCIDFYGGNIAAEAPEDLIYVSPRGQTAFTPDPIGILKGAPNRELAQRFVDFVLSTRGQALFGLPVGAADGPARTALGRQPIRRDVYEIYAGKLSPGLVVPYQAGNEMALDVEIRGVRFGVLKQLVRAAAIDNLNDMRAAQRALIDHPSPQRLAEFNRLPDNVATVEGIVDVAGKLRDPTEAERIISAWQEFFRNKYRRIAP